MYLIRGGFLIWGAFLSGIAVISRSIFIDKSTRFDTFLSDDIILYSKSGAESVDTSVDTVDAISVPDLDYKNA